MLRATRIVRSAAAQAEQIANDFIFGYTPRAAALKEVVESVQTSDDLQHVEQGIKEFRLHGVAVKPGVASALVSKCIEIDETPKLMSMLQNNRQHGLFPTASDYNSLSSHLNDKQQFMDAKTMFDQLVVDRVYSPNVMSYHHVSRACLCIGTTSMCSLLLQYIEAGRQDGVRMTANTLQRAAAAAAVRKHSNSAQQLWKDAQSARTAACTDDVAVACEAILCAMANDSSGLSACVDHIKQLDDVPPELAVWLPRIPSREPASATTVEQAIAALHAAGMHLQHASALTMDSEEGTDATAAAASEEAQDETK